MFASAKNLRLQPVATGNQPCVPSSLGLDFCHGPARPVPVAAVGGGAVPEGAPVADVQGYAEHCAGEVSAAAERNGGGV